MRVWCDFPVYGDNLVDINSLKLSKCCFDGIKDGYIGVISCQNVVLECFWVGSGLIFYYINTIIVA